MKSIFNKVLDLASYILFGLCVFSIPTFSFIGSLYVLTWVLTILFVFISFLKMVLFGKVRITVITLFFSFFILSALISNLTNYFITFSTSVFFNSAIIIYVYTFCLSDIKANKKMLNMAFYGIFAFAIVFAFSYRKELLSFDFERLGAKFGDINDVSIILSIGFCLSISKLFEKKKWFASLFYVISSFVFLLLSFVSGSKISIILAIIVVSTAIIVLFGKKRWYISLILFVVLTIGITILINLPPFATLKQRFLEMVNTFVGGSISGVNVSASTIDRNGMFNNAISLFLRRPIFGYGQLGFREFSTYHNGWSHNHISDSLCNYGIVGTILYHFPFVIFLHKGIVQNVEKNKEAVLLFLLFLTSMISVALFREKFFTYIGPIVFSYISLSDIACFSIRKGKIIHENRSVNN